MFLLWPAEVLQLFSFVTDPQKGQLLYDIPFSSCRGNNQF